MFTVNTINVCGRTLNPGDDWLMEIQGGVANDVQPDAEHRFQFYLDLRGVPWISSWGGTDLPEGQRLELKGGNWTRITREMRVRVDHESARGTLALHVRREELVPTWYNGDTEVPAQLPPPKLREFTSGSRRRVPRDEKERLNRGPLNLFGKLVPHGEEFLMVGSEGIHLGQTVEATTVLAIGMDSRGWPHCRTVTGKVQLNGAELARSRTYLDADGHDHVTFPDFPDLELTFEAKCRGGHGEGFHVKWRRKI
jgi:hypothetical protein